MERKAAQNKKNEKLKQGLPRHRTRREQTWERNAYLPLITECDHLPSQLTVKTGN